MTGALLLPGAEFLGHTTAGTGCAGRRAGADADPAPFHQPVPLARDAVHPLLVEIEAIRAQRFRDAVSLGRAAAPADDDFPTASGGTARRILDRASQWTGRREVGRQQQRERDQRMLCPVLAQSAMKPWMPFSVSGWLNRARITAGGAVITSAPIFAASSMWIG